MTTAPLNTLNDDALPVDESALPSETDEEEEAELEIEEAVLAENRDVGGEIENEPKILPKQDDIPQGMAGAVREEDGDVETDGEDLENGK